MMIIVGATSPVGLAWTKTLNQNGFYYLALVDSDFTEKTSPGNTLKSWFQLLERRLIPWTRDHKEEIEFIFWCKSPVAEPDYLPLKELWKLGRREQIPVMVITSTETDTQHYIPEAYAPFYWINLRIKGILISKENDHSILFTKNRKNENMFTTYLSDVTEVMYYFIHHRKHSGSYWVPFQFTPEDIYRPTRPSDTSQTKLYPLDSQAAINKLQEIGYPFKFTSVRGH